LNIQGLEAEDSDLPRDSFIWTFRSRYIHLGAA